MSREVRVRGVVLKGVVVGDADEIFTLYTKEKGKIRVKAKGVRKQGSKLLSLLLPACEVNLRLVGKEGMRIVAGGKVEKMFTEIWRDDEKTRVFYWISEAIIKSTPDEEVDLHLYGLMIRVLGFMSQEKSYPADEFFCYTVIRFVQVLGFSVLGAGEDIIRYPVFSFSRGGFCEKEEAGDGIPVAVDVVKAYRVLSESVATNLPQGLSGVSELKQLLLRFFDYQIERKINSAAFV